MTGQSGFDFDGTAIYTCGEIYLNGEKQTEIVNSMPEGGGLNGVKMAVQPLADKDKQKRIAFN